MTNKLDFSRLPDSELCAAAIDHARRASEPFLFHHVMRSAVYADTMGRRRKVKFDPEVLCTATVLHDLGLTASAPAQARFELEGADAAKEFLVKRGMSEKGVELVWEAIALHTTAEIPARRSPEVALCQLGIAVDLSLVPPDLSDREVDQVLETYPWLGLSEALPRTLAGLYQRSPKALGSHAVADACVIHVPGFKRFNLCEHLIGRSGPLRGH